MNELLEFVWSNYREMRRYSKEQLVNFLELYKNKTIIIKDKDKITGVGIYFKLSDKTLKEVKERILDIKRPNNVNYCFRQNGKNIHFILAVASGIKIIRKAINKAIEKENPKTISWFSPNMEQFFIRRI